jgi:mediator of RNA polymerase II transcription subunit 7
MAETEQVYDNFILPPPPPYYKNFTEKNLQRLKELKEALPALEGEDGDKATRASTLLDLPPELRCLVPPEPPEDGVVQNFGEVKTVRADGSKTHIMGYIADCF